MDMVEKLFKELQTRGHKLTKQRMAILKVLNGSEIPLTAEEMFLRIREGNDNTSLATVYRNLKTLVEAGLVVKFGLMEDKVQYRLQSSAHSHDLICLGCHKVVRLTSCPLDCLSESIGQKEGFTVTDHRMELYGYCLECGKKEEKNNIEE